MRRYQKWFSVGLLALTPGITLAGPFSRSEKKPPAPAASRQAANPDQELANKVAGSLKKAHLSGYEIDIEVNDGEATLKGMVTSPQQKADATKAASAVVGLKRIKNQLSVAEPAARRPVQQVAASQPRTPRQQPVRTAAAYEGQEPAQVPATGALQPDPMRPMGPAPAPMFGAPTGSASHVIYNQPNNPNYAWPAYAQYPNYAAVTYPTQYSASAWPYIGPFYPYPQVPLGWRKATLEWDDGYWNLSFSPRTDRWWWFLDWRNW